LISRGLKNDVPGIPKVNFNIVDVRDVALAHVIPLEKIEETKGKRYILYADNGSFWMEDYMTILREEFSPYGYKIPSMRVPNWVFSIVCLWDK